MDDKFGWWSLAHFSLRQEQLGTYSYRQATSNTRSLWDRPFI